MKKPNCINYTDKERALLQPRVGRMTREVLEEEMCRAQRPPWPSNHPHGEWVCRGTMPQPAATKRPWTARGIVRAIREPTLGTMRAQGRGKAEFSVVSTVALRINNHFQNHCYDAAPAPPCGCTAQAGIEERTPGSTHIYITHHRASGFLTQ